MESHSGDGERFLHRKDSNLQSSLAVELEQIHRQQADEETHTKPADKIADWLQVLEQTHGHRDDPRVLDRIKASYHKEYVITPEAIPEAAYQLEARIARQLGHGDIEVTPEYRTAKAAEIIAGQEQSLDRWVDYLTSEDAMYPTWAKYWAFTGVTKMGKYEKYTDNEGHEASRFAKRTSDTVASFPPVNPRALALSIGAIEHKVGQQNLPKANRQLHNTSELLDDSSFTQLLSGESFSQVYAQFLLELPAYSADGLRETRGQWVTYPEQSDAKPLSDSLVGYPLEWCTADLDTAQSQLNGGDFYVYYSLDEAGSATIPRVAIRMEDDRIAEVRGIAPDQNLDPYIGDVVAAKMADFPDSEDYRQKAADMQRMTQLDEQVASGTALTREDLKFLYEFDHQIKGFGYRRDPRIKELLTGRDLITDVNDIMCPDGVAGHWEGNLRLSRLTSAKGLTLPESVDGYLDLYSLTSAEGLKLPESVGGGLNLYSLTSAVGLKLPKSVGGYLDLGSLTSADGLKLPENVTGDLSLASLTSAGGLQLPESVTGGLNLYSLTSAEGLKLPESVGGNLSLYSLTSAVGLQLPENMSGGLYLNNLTSPVGLQLPESVGGNLDLESLTSAEGLKLPESVGGNLSLYSLTSADGLVLPTNYNSWVTVSYDMPWADIYDLQARYPNANIRFEDYDSDD